MQVNKNCLKKKKRFLLPGFIGSFQKNFFLHSLGIKQIRSHASQYLFSAGLSGKLPLEIVVSLAAVIAVLSVDGQLLSACR